MYTHIYSSKDCSIMMFYFTTFFLRKSHIFYMACKFITRVYGSRNSQYAHEHFAFFFCILMTIYTGLKRYVILICTSLMIIAIEHCFIDLSTVYLLTIYQ